MNLVVLFAILLIVVMSIKFFFLLKFIQLSSNTKTIKSFLSKEILTHQESSTLTITGQMFKQQNGSFPGNPLCPFSICVSESASDYYCLCTLDTIANDSTNRY